MVGASGGEAAGGGVEVEAEHRLQVVPVDLHRPAPHLALAVFLLLRWIPPPPPPRSPPISLSSCLVVRALSLTHSLSLSLGFGCHGGKREAIGRAHLLAGGFFFERGKALPLLLLGPWAWGVSCVGPYFSVGS